MEIQGTYDYKEEKSEFELNVKLFGHNWCVYGNLMHNSYEVIASSCNTGLGVEYEKYSESEYEMEITAIFPQDWKMAHYDEHNICDEWVDSPESQAYVNSVLCAIEKLINKQL